MLRVNFRLLLPAMLAVSLAVMGCGSDSSTGNNGNEDTGPDVTDDGTPQADVDPSDVEVGTTVSKDEVGVGEEFTVTCSVTLDGETVKLNTEIEVDAPEGKFEVDGNTVTITVEGDFEVTCVLADDPEVKDPTPATVKVGAGAAAKVETILAKTSCKAGEAVEVTCKVMDQFSNEIDAETEIEFSPDTGSAADGKFTPEKVGTYDVACAVKDSEIVDETPEELTVTAGNVAKVTTKLADDTIDAGGSTTVTCEAIDQFGNAVSGVDITVVGPESVSVDGMTVSSTVAGTFEITCTPDPVEGVDLESANLTIEALDPTGLELKLTPNKPVYKVGDQVTVGFSLVDIYGNPIPGGAIDVPTGDPADQLKHNSDYVFKFLAEGKFTFFSCVTGDPGMCDDIEAWVDITAPIVSVEYPERGVTLNGGLVINVTGTVHEEVSSLAVLKVNGVEVAVDENGNFAHPLNAVQGMNLIATYAEDIFGNNMTTFRSFYFSNQYYTVDNNNPLSSVVPRSVSLYLDDKLFFNPDPNDPNNLTAILSGVLGGLDLTTLLPNPAGEFTQLGCTYALYINSITYDAPQLSVKTVPGGLQLAVVVPNFSADVELDKTDGGFLCPGGVSGNASAASVDVKVLVSITIDPLTHQLHLTKSDTDVVFNELDISLDGAAGFFLNWLIGLFESTIVNMLKDEVDKALNDLLVDLDASIQEFIGKPIVLPIDPLIPGMNPVTLNIHIDPSLSSFNEAGGAIEAGLAVTADKLIDKNPLGSIGRNSCLATTPENFQFDTTNPEKILLAAFTDALNEALFSFWWNSGLNLNITGESLAEMGTDLGQYGIVDLNVTTAPMLPPILNGCGEDGMLTAQLGDFYVEADFGMFGQPVDVHMYLFLEVKAEFGIITDEEGLKIAITIHEPELVEVEVAYVNDVWVGKEETFVSLIKDTLIPMVFEDLAAEPITFALPTFNLAELTATDPGEEPSPIQLPNKDLVIDLKSIEHYLGYLVAEAGLILQDPVPEVPPAP